MALIWNAKTRKFTTQRTFSSLWEWMQSKWTGNMESRNTSATKWMDGYEQGLCSRLGEQVVQVRAGIRGVSQKTFRENPSMLFLKGVLTFYCHLLSLQLLSMAVCSYLALSFLLLLFFSSVFFLLNIDPQLDNSVWPEAGWKDLKMLAEAGPLVDSKEGHVQGPRRKELWLEKVQLLHAGYMQEWLSQREEVTHNWLFCKELLDDIIWCLLLWIKLSWNLVA